MAFPRSKEQLNTVISSYLNISKDGELQKGTLLANFRAKTNPEFCEYLKAFYGERWTDSLISPVLTAANKLDKTVNKQAKNIKRPNKSEGILTLLNAQFNLPSPTPRKRLLSDIGAPVGNAESSKKSRTAGCKDCSTFKDVSDKLGAENYKLGTENSKLEAEVAKQNEALEKAKKIIARRRKHDPRVLNQHIDRLIQRRKELNQQVKSYKTKVNKLEKDLEKEKKLREAEQHTHEEFKKLKNELRRVKNQKSAALSDKRTAQVNKALTEKKCTLTKENEALRETVKAMDAEMCEIKESENIIETKEGKQFNDKTRKCIVYCTQNNVAHDKASDIVSYVIKEMTGKSVKALPKKSAVGNMTRQFGVISDIQAGMIMSGSTNVTIGHDGTTKDGTHINELHAHTASGSLTLSIAPMPAGRAKEYTTNIREGLDDITSAYSNYANIEKNETKQQINGGMYIRKGSAIILHKSEKI